MNILNVITAESYALIKRSPGLKKAIQPIYRFSAIIFSYFRATKKSVVKIEAIKTCHSVEEWIGVYGDRDNTFQLIRSSEPVHRKLPATLGAIHWKFLFNQGDVLPRTFVARLKGARVLAEGQIIAPDNKLLTEVSKIIKNGEYQELSLNDYFFTSRKNIDCEKIDSIVAVLTAPSGRGYYHWMFDVLPRLALIEKAGIKLHEIDYFLVNNYMTRFHVETLTLLGITESKIVTSHFHPAIEVKELILPSLVGMTGRIPQWACEFLRARFLIAKSKTIFTSTRVYINRGQVAHRKVANEGKLVAALMDLKFISVSLESLSFADQIKLLRQATCVIAPHGAGLTNLVFCSPGTKVFEILSPLAVNIMYWTLCNQLNLEYHYLLTEEAAHIVEGEDRYENSADLNVNIDSLLKLLNVAGVQ